MTGVVLAAWRVETNAYRRNARGLRDRQAFERVRLQAGELFAAGRSQAEVARQLFWTHAETIGGRRIPLQRVGWPDRPGCSGTARWQPAATMTGRVIALLAWGGLQV